MTDTLRQATYKHAAACADLALARGLPVLGFDEFDAGHQFGIAFQKGDRRSALRFAADQGPEEVLSILQRELGQ